MKSIYERALQNAMTYEEYLKLVDEKVEQNASTGHTQNEMLTEFTKLNRARMKRIDKTQELLPEMKEVLQSIEQSQIWFVLLESWCGDAAQNVPVIAKIAEACDNVELKLVLRDDNDELMQQYLTNGARSIPKVIAVSKDLNEFLFTWGDRPKAAAQLVADLKSQYGSVTAEVKEALQRWYLEDKGVSLQKEFIQLIK